MIYGIGTDICDIRRIEATWQRQGERFVRKVLTDAEFAVWQTRSARWPQRGLRYLATRFSAKEAFSKAIGLGMRMPMTWRRCEIVNQPSGQPVVVLHGELKTWFEARSLRAHVTVTDETDYAASFVVVERDDSQAPSHLRGESGAPPLRGSLPPEGAASPWGGPAANHQPYPPI